MDLIYMNENREDIGVLQDYSLDLAFGADENNFECQVQADNHCCKKNYMLYMEGTEYGGIVDGIGVDTENNAVTYSGRTWHGILSSKVIMPAKPEDFANQPSTPDTSLLPDGYTQLESISCTGTQYIDTGYKPNQNTRVVMDFQSTADSKHIFGARTEFLNKGFLCCWLSDFVYCVQVGNKNYNGGVFDSRTRHTVEMSASEFKVDGVTMATYTVDNFQCDYNLWIAACSNSNTDENMRGSIYAFQVYEGDTKVRDYVPCYNDSGVNGMYDTVNGVFYANDGTGSFTAGAVIEKEPEPEQEDVINVTVKQSDSSGSLVDKYLVISGDAHDCIKFVLSRCGLSDLFSVSDDASGINIKDYQFDRFIDAYKGLRKMLASVNQLLHFSFDGSMVILSAIPKHDYSTDEEFDSDLLDFEMVRQENKVNHLICLGGGELENRLVRHLYVDADGKIGETQTFFGLEEYAVIYDYANVESEEELLKAGREKLKELHDTDSLNIDFEAEDDLYNVGDIVGAVDNVTGVSIAAEIVKKIIQIKDGRTIISYEVGD